jgi:hypothetical protein
MHGMEISKPPLFICAAQSESSNKNDLQEPISMYVLSDSPENVLIRHLSFPVGFGLK